MTAWCTASCSGSARRKRSTSGSSASAASAPRGHSSSQIRKGSRWSWSSTSPATRRWSHAIPEIPEEHAIRGFAGVRAYASRPERSAPLLEALGFTPGWEARGDRRGGFYHHDVPPEASGLHGAGTVHHVAWSSLPDEHESWRQRVLESGLSPTPVVDRFYFKSIYFREPSGVLFEIATIGPGFTADEPLETLGESLSLPPNFEHLRDRLAGVLTPLPVPRAVLARSGSGVD